MSNGKGNRRRQAKYREWRRLIVSQLEVGQSMGQAIRRVINLVGHDLDFDAGSLQEKVECSDIPRLEEAGSIDLNKVYLVVVA